MFMITSLLMLAYIQVHFQTTEKGTAVNAFSFTFWIAWYMILKYMRRRKPRYTSNSQRLDPEANARTTQPIHCRRVG